MTDHSHLIEQAAKALVNAWEQAGKDWLANRSEEQQDYATAPWIGVPELWLAEAALSPVLDERDRLEARVRELEEGLTGLMAAVYALSPAQPPTKTQWDDLAVGLARARSLLEGETLDG